MIPTFSRKTALIVLALLILCCSGCATLKCEPPSVDLTGTWKYYVGKLHDPAGYTTQTITLNQTGNTFSGVNQANTINGTVIGNNVHLTLVITGETMEGYVLRAEGNYFDGKIAAVFTASNGKTGYWNAIRQ